ncbi:hypothetical protein LNQ81_10565 [Myroides sp. M-43]|uniref:hypothetical protein n=1 Tax=Myroides oncorhynchi TaxID=2893756 RepID=UPI001E2C72CB|nr:hypothetical protein [Myroides oncorhynchi]MCC9043116.1 hypothetical protein [Myroides oncorhynchi]
MRIKMHNKYSNNNNPKHVFKIPEDYFANLESRVISAVENTTPTPKVIPLYKNKFVWMVAVACIALFVGISTVYKTEKSNRINNENIETYLEYNQSYSLNNEIINSLNEEDLEDLEDNIEIQQSQLDHYLLSHIDIEYYLNE